uniref:Uncharacterized protein n=1 Tax=Cannabis sativa TaxID=3483 RepID=A0A803PV80_CANSA
MARVWVQSRSCSGSRVQSSLGPGSLPGSWDWGPGPVQFWSSPVSGPSVQGPVSVLVLGSGLGPVWVQVSSWFGSRSQGPSPSPGPEVRIRGLSPGFEEQWSGPGFESEVPGLVPCSVSVRLGSVSVSSPGPVSGLKSGSQVRPVLGPGLVRIRVPAQSLPRPSGSGSRSCLGSVRAQSCFGSCPGPSLVQSRSSPSPCVRPCSVLPRVRVWVPGPSSCPVLGLGPGVLGLCLWSKSVQCVPSESGPEALLLSLFLPGPCLVRPCPGSGSVFAVVLGLGPGPVRVQSQGIRVLN